MALTGPMEKFDQGRPCEAKEAPVMMSVKSDEPVLFYLADQ
jgi:hypothetical protein